MGFGRKERALRALREEHPLFNFAVADFTSRVGQDETLRYLLHDTFSKLFIVAGGGPYGLFHDREWKDHQWSWDLTFQFPARVLHAMRVAERSGVQVVVVGSAVAENAPDPRAASYCAAKHALCGLVQSLQLETPDWDLRLFSPGYMDTELLPPGAPARRLGVYDPRLVARELWEWCLNADIGGHKVYASHPSE